VIPPTGGFKKRPEGPPENCSVSLLKVSEAVGNEVKRIALISFWLLCAVGSIDVLIDKQQLIAD
jgi:hypothetical protein